jgi:hypothetical protein
MGFRGQGGAAKFGESRTTKLADRDVGAEITEIAAPIRLTGRHGDASKATTSGIIGRIPNFYET